MIVHTVSSPTIHHYSIIMENLRSVKLPQGAPGAAGTLVKIALLGGAAVVGAVNSLFNVEGGHRAIVFNRLTGIKDTVRFVARRMQTTQCHIFILY